MLLMGFHDVAFLSEDIVNALDVYSIFVRFGLLGLRFIVQAEGLIPINLLG